MYVTGWSFNADTWFDFTTHKYAPDGTLLWQRFYNGPDNGADYAQALTLDVAGNVYVTGWSRGISSSFDFATLKYLPDGRVDWGCRFNGAVNPLGAGLWDTALSLVVDRDGNVYVCGWSQTPETPADSAIIKYKPRN